MEIYEKKGWSPYLAGALSGILSIMSVWIVGKYFGASTTFVRSIGMIEKFFSPERVSKIPYFIKEIPQVDWQWMFVVGIFLGSFISAVTSGTFRLSSIPNLWEKRFGKSKMKRGIVAFGGGIIAMYGARLADGCPSGHGLSGLLQLAISGYIALACFFIGGIFIARILYGGGKPR